MTGSPFEWGLYQCYDKELRQTYHSQRHVVDTFHSASKLKWFFLVIVVRLDHLVHEGGAVGGELLTRGGAVGGGQVEEGVHLVGLGLIFTMQLYRY